MKKNHGFTLIELMVAIAVMLIMFTIGVPQYQRIVENNRRVDGINAIIGDLNLARTEAVKQGMTVTICGSSDGLTCNTPNWENGWIIFTDQNRDAAINGVDTILVRKNGLPAGMTLRSVNFDSFSVVQYMPSGELRDTSGDNMDAGTFIVCDNEANNDTRARAANINRLGRIMTARDTDANNIRNDNLGNDIVCP